MNYLNLGCGHRYSEDWTNVDFISTGPGVKAYNLTKGIPFPDASFEVVYHSHVLEHFSKQDALHFIRECYRVLKPEGILRVVVPDLEQIVKEYLKNLEQAKKGNIKARGNYEWIMLEMYDQTVRNTSGGEMAAYWKKDDLENEEYVISRHGHEFINFRQKYFNQKRANLEKATGNNWKKYLKISNYKNRLIQLLSGDKQIQQYINIGKFRTSGEIHQWMYDEYSLGQLLKAASFNDIKRETAYSSNIPAWERHKFLDVENGQIRKPDSLFMEAVK